jgi:hypothetical protein
MRMSLRSSLALGCVLLGCSSGVEEPEAGAKVTDGATDASGSSNVSGSNSGGLSPAKPLRRQPLTQAEVDEYRRELARMFMKQANPKRIHAGSAELVSVEGHTNAIVATVTEDGTIERSCTNDPDQALRFLTEPRTALEVK